MFENPRGGRQARNFTNVPKILDLKSSSEQIFSRKLSLGAPVLILFDKLIICTCNGRLIANPKSEASVFILSMYLK